MLQVREGKRIFSVGWDAKENSHFMVRQTDSKGVNLVLCDHFGDPYIHARKGHFHYRWTLPNWEDTFDRARKRKKTLEV